MPAIPYSPDSAARCVALVLLSGMALLSPYPAFAQEERPAQEARPAQKARPAQEARPAPEAGLRAERPVIPLLTGPIEVDGRVDELAWDAVPVLPVVMHTPNFGGTPTEVTEFRVAHDGEYLYMSCRAFDSDPSGIRTPSLQRDEGSFSNDWCILTLDTFNDKETSLTFGTTPAGLRTDVIFTNDAEGSPNFDWNTFWDVAVHRDPRGWFAEMRIPFSSLNFQEVNGEVVMGMSVFRIIARKNEVAIYPPISPRWGLFSPFKASQAQEVVIQGARRGNPLYITPYLIGGRGHSHDLSDDETAYLRDPDHLTETGADVKYALTPNLTLDLTVNTDFAQVEADNQQVNLTRFSLFFPEKRSFFQERSNVFDYSIGGSGRLFHSRRIGLVSGDQVRIYGGARLVGRVGEWDVGGLSMQTAGRAGGDPTENLAVVRVRRRVLNSNSYVGGIVTTRLGGEDQSVVYGTDAILRLFGQDFLTLNWAQSFDEEDSSSDGFLDRGLARLYWQRRGIDGLTYELDLTRSGEAFEPALGFMFRSDYTKLETTVRYGWRPGAQSELLQHGPSVRGTLFRRGEDGSTETAEIAPQWVVEWKSGHRITVSARTTYDDLTKSFSLPEDTEVLAGDYTFTNARLAFRQSLAAIFRTNANVEYGGFYGGTRSSASVTSTWNPSKHFEFLGSYRIEDVDFSDRHQGFTAHIARFRTEARLNTQLSGAALVQYSSAANSVSLNVRVRYNPREGNDLYIVWNEGLVTDRFSFDPVRPLSDRRTLLVKYSRTLTMGL